MLQSLRLWLLSTVLSSLLSIPKSLWSGLLGQVRALDADALTNDQKQAAAQEWLRDSARGLLVRTAALSPPIGLFSQAVIRRAVQCAVITVRIEQLLSPDTTSTTAP